ncbi:MAG: FG-GAP-like repeat-containing protein, partial [Tannerella sp.]|nr:FG-GAP-like repeat-containing protein [Tannerella sp.]
MKMKNVSIILLTALCCLVAGGRRAQAQFYYNESCRNATGDFQYYGHALGYTAGFGTNPDAAGDGWLRLTDTLKRQNGYVLLDKSFPSNLGVTIEFDFTIWAPPPMYTYGLADGFCVFLFDGDPTKPFKIGTAGANLGYALMEPAYLGIGIDEYGNFSNPIEDHIGKGGPGNTKHSISLRNADYEYVIGTSSYLGTFTALGYTTATSTRPDDATFYRRVRIDMEPITTPGKEGMTVTVYIKTSSGGNFTAILGPVDVEQATPQTLRLGFNGSTGSGWAYHEVRDVVIRTPGDLSVFKTINDCPTLDNVIINTTIANNMNMAATGVAVADTLPADFTLAGTPTATGGTMSVPVISSATGGKTVYSYTIDAPANTAVRIVYNGRFTTAPSNSTFTSSAEITPPGIDSDLSDNYAVVTGRFDQFARLSPDTYTSIPLTGDPVELRVTADNASAVASYAWAASTDNGAAWTSVAGSASACTYAGVDNALVRCVALWDFGCRDTVVFRLAKAPDNVSDADCFVDAPATAWGITQAFISAETNLATYVSPVAGDLNDDGIPEILAGKFLRDNATSDGGDRIIDGIYIYWGHDREHPTLVNIREAYFEGYGFSIAKVKIDGVYQPVIITIGHVNDDGYLYAYSPDSTKTTEAASRIWKSSHPMTGHNNKHAYSIGLVDFDGDGEVEIYAGNQIFDAASGTMLIDGGSATNKGLNHVYYHYYFHFPFAADVTGDDKPEYLAGTEAYSVNIDSRTDHTQNSLTRIAYIPDILITGSFYLKDGSTTVADINRDGRLDVIVSALLDNDTYGFAAWDVQTQSLIAKGYGSTAGASMSVPFIGNIDSDPNPEILMVSANKIRGYRWDGNQTFVEKYDYNVVDASGSTGITMFDFNQDNIMELVYRDQTHLRILQANEPSFTDAGTFPARSGTSCEHAIVADVDNDGQAEIITVGGSSSSMYGTLRIFKDGSGTKWAPARKVWNQYGYNAVNVNEDLTIPRYQFNPASVFPGANGAFGDGDDLQPFNAFLQQQTALSRNGTPYWLTPRAEKLPAPEFYYDAAKDSLTVRMEVTNIG